MAAFTDHYRTLGVHRHAEDAVVDAAYRAMARRYHPDLNPGDQGAEERLKTINRAYEELSDPSRRRAYDREWDAQYAPKPPPPKRDRPKSPPPAPPPTPPPPPPRAAQPPPQPPPQSPRPTAGRAARSGKRPWYVNVLGLVALIAALRFGAGFISSPNPAQIPPASQNERTVGAKTPTPRSRAPVAAQPSTSSGVPGVLLSGPSTGSLDWGFLDVFDPKLYRATWNTETSVGRVLDEGFEIEIKTPGELEGIVYDAAPSEGRDITFSLGLGETTGWGEIVVFVREPKGEPEWTFAIDPVAEQWSLYRASTTTTDLFYWVEPRSYSATADGPLRRIEVLVEGRKPSLLLNGKDVVSLYGIGMPEMPNNIVVGFGAGINPYSLTGSGNSFTVVFERVELRETR